MQDNLITRLNHFLTSKGISSTNFADSCGIPRPSGSQLLAGRNQKVSDAIISKIHSAYPDLNIIWLMFGEGDMIKSENEGTIHEGSSEKDKSDVVVSEMHAIGQDANEFANLKGLTMPETMANKLENQENEYNKRIIELQMQIDKMKENPRKVAQITIYYDDSTFETFVPAK